MQYRRNTIDGGTYFFTVNLAERSRHWLVEHVDALREAVRIVKERYPFYVDAMVILPDHLHAVWTFPPGDAEYPTRWMLIKAGFSRRIPAGERINASRRGKGERGVWQRRYWEHTIRDDEDLRRHIDYVHYNPVKHGYVTRSVDWPHSSLHRYIREGILPADWGVATIPMDNGEFGESR
jgi:putative transposase